MSAALWIMIALLVYAMVAVVYVYRYRGQVRYADFGQYLRKSWPLFAPFNCLLYLATRREARRPVVEPHYLDGIHRLRRNWRRIRDEAMALYASGEIDAASAPGTAGHDDVGFRTFHKRGWRRFYLTWYGPAHASAERLCPSTVRLVEGIPGVRAAMFSVLPPGSELSLHSDPLACSLRYHLGLDTPESDDCFICVDGHSIAWRNGQDFVFDETYPHYVKNNTDAVRVILMCDVERPMAWPGRLFNLLYAGLARGMTVPNTPEDWQGPISWLFGALGPVRVLGLRLKERHRGLYQVLKLTLNACLLVLAAGTVFAVLECLHSLLALLGHTSIGMRSLLP